MKLDACLAGVGMTRFGKHMDTGLKALGCEAVRAALVDARLGPGDLEAAFVGNAAAGLVTGQECIRGQVILRAMGLGRLPVINVENACASGSTALHEAAAMVTAGNPSMHWKSAEAPGCACRAFSNHALASACSAETCPRQMSRTSSE